jgi:hypothetical protein
MSHEPLPVFVSYASYDNESQNAEERWLDRLLQFLKPLNLDKSISIWSDTELNVGENWKSEIRTSIEKARVAILLVSPAFLASEFIRTKELPQILRSANPIDKPGNEGAETSEGMLILPILLRPCLIHDVKFQVLSNPSELNYARLSDFQYVPKRKAMNGLSQYEQDMQLQHIAKRIIDIVGSNNSDMPTAVTIPEDDMEILKNSLQNFLSKFDRWWFNALRIQLWGGQQDGFENLGEYSVNQLTAALDDLNQFGFIQKKYGKKSWVYKAMY